MSPEWFNKTESPKEYPRFPGDLDNGHLSSARSIHLFTLSGFLKLRQGGRRSDREGGKENRQASSRESSSPARRRNRFSWKKYIYFFIKRSNQQTLFAHNEELYFVQTSLFAFLVPCTSALKRGFWGTPNVQLLLKRSVSCVFWMCWR